MRAYYARRAPEYDDWWLGTGVFAKRDRPGWNAEVEQLVRVLEDLPAARTLDVACGTAFLTTHNSSIGRLGLVVHATAGFVDPGFKGTLTLEIANFNSVPIVLRPGLPICQLSFMALDRPAERPYGHPDLGSHYYGQVEATESRYRG